MNRMGGIARGAGNSASGVMEGVSAISKVIEKLPGPLKEAMQWFKGNKTHIDNFAFRLHYQISAMLLAAGFLLISDYNWLTSSNERMICHTDKASDMTEYVKKYCWLHGTAFVRKSLQGKASGCFVDQSKITYGEDVPVTAYYLWLPYLLSVCFLLTRLPRSIWKRQLEGGMIARLVRAEDTSDRRAHEIATTFVKFRYSFSLYHKKFLFAELLNGFALCFSIFINNLLLNGQFWSYGYKVLMFLNDGAREVSEADNEFQRVGIMTHNPMCELFPTEVGCSLRYGATTGAINRSDFLCILGGNVFNQKFFFILWLWWAFLLIATVVAIVYRLARIQSPFISWSMLKRHVPEQQVPTHLLFGSSDFFVLDRMAQNLDEDTMEKVLHEIEKVLEATAPKTNAPLLPLYYPN